MWHRNGVYYSYMPFLFVRKTPIAAMLAMTAALWCGCANWPWLRETEELNLVVRFDRNVPTVEGVVAGRAMRFVVGLGQTASVIDPASIESADPLVVTLGGRRSLRLQPAALPLQGMADGILGSDAWREKIVTLDYEKRLLSIRTKATDMQDSVRFTYNDIPTISVTIDGRTVPAIVDTAIPDTLLIPASGPVRRERHQIAIGPDRFLEDVRLGGVTEARVGSRILSRYLVTADDRHRTVSLWRRR